MNPYLIDRDARTRLAEEVRHLAAGIITNRQFEDRRPTSDDVAVREIEDIIWELYDDLKEHKLTCRYAMSPEQRTLLARMILFLKTYQPWPEPVLSRLSWLALFIAMTALLASTLVTFSPVAWSCVVAMFIGRFAYVRRWRRTVDLSIWPFASHEAFSAARQNPAYLAGAKAGGR